LKTHLFRPGVTSRNFPQIDRKHEIELAITWSDLKVILQEIGKEKKSMNLKQSYWEIEKSFLSKTK